MTTKSPQNESSSSDDSTLTPAQVRALLLEEQQRINADLREAKQALAAACANIKNHTPEQITKLRGRVAALKFKSQRIQLEIGTAREAGKIRPPEPKVQQQHQPEIMNAPENINVDIVLPRRRGDLAKPMWR
jgi:hypothetical protein